MQHLLRLLSRRRRVPLSANQRLATGWMSARRAPAGAMPLAPPAPSAKTPSPRPGTPLSPCSTFTTPPRCHQYSRRSRCSHLVDSPSVGPPLPAVPSRAARLLDKRHQPMPPSRHHAPPTSHHARHAPQRRCLHHRRLAVLRVWWSACFTCWTRSESIYLLCVRLYQKFHLAPHGFSRRRTVRSLSVSRRHAPRATRRSVTSSVAYKAAAASQGLYSENLIS